VTRLSRGRRRARVRRCRARRRGHAWHRDCKSATGCGSWAWHFPAPGSDGYRGPRGPAARGTVTDGGGRRLPISGRGTGVTAAARPENVTRRAPAGGPDPGSRRAVSAAGRPGFVGLSELGSDSESDSEDHALAAGAGRRLPRNMKNPTRRHAKTEHNHTQAGNNLN
jgi:hypothetical protein